MEAGRRLDNRAAVEVDTSGAKIGPVLRRSVYEGVFQQPAKQGDAMGTAQCAHSHRKTFADSAVNTTITNASAATSPACADHASPFQIPLSSDTA